VKDLADELTRRSIAVTVLVPTAAAGASCEISTEESIEVIRVRTSKTKGAAKLLRGIREVRFSQQIWARARAILSQRNFDLIIFFSPTIFLGPLVERLKTRFGCPAYLVLRDLWTQFMLDVGELRPGVVHKYLSRFERKQYSVADVIGVQSPGDLTYFDSDRSSGKESVELLFNWYSEGSRANRRTDYRERLGLADRVVFFFGGNFGVAQDPLNVLRLASALRAEPRIHLLLVGWGSHLPAMRTMISECGLTNVTLLDTVPQDEFTAILREADVGIISLDRRFKINNLPGRLLAYFSAGLPVLASVNPSSDLFAILNDNGVGYCCRNGDDESLRKYALDLAGDASLRTTLGHRGRSLLETTFSAKRAADQILAHFALGRFAHPEGSVSRWNAPW
jgi:glycosyltransferase involved in cell wall biosynthesis